MLLKQRGYVDGHNVTIEYRGTQQYERLPLLAAELVGLKVAVIYATANANSARAAIAASKTIPIVFANGTDPVRTGLVASMNRPGGNATGITYYAGALVAKRLELIREILGSHMTIGFMTNPTNIISEGNLDDIRAASATVGQRLIVLYASSETEISAAFATAHQETSARFWSMSTQHSIGSGNKSLALQSSIGYRLAMRPANMCTAAV